MWSLFRQPALYTRLKHHFGCDPEQLPVVAQMYDMHNRANCQLEGAGDLVVRDEHLEEALGELLIEGGPLTQSLVGARSKGVAGFGNRPSVG